MKHDFDSILVSVLEKYEVNPEMDMEKFLSSIISELNLSDEDIEKIKDTHELIDLFKLATAISDATESVYNSELSSENE